MSATSVRDFIARWHVSGAAERSNKDMFLTELCDVLEVDRPKPATGNAKRDGYIFEKGTLILKDGARTTTGHVDLFKAGCFVLEAKQGSDEDSSTSRAMKRGTGAWSNAMQEAYGQALGYARTLDEPPPFLIVCDIGYCFDLYATFDGSLDYRPFPDPRRSRLFLSGLADHLDTLRAVFTEPHRLDPSKISAKVTREIAGHLAELARGLEAEGHDPEQIARFLMRCLFTMFAEDAGLLPERIFTNELTKAWVKDPTRFPAGCEALWRAMEAGHDFGFLGRLLRFNGGLFQDPTALPLSKADLERLLEAARASWVEVEPAIFGTLLERALDPRERHRLGAHYTPRAYVERLVKPTIEEPVRAEWDTVRTLVHQLVAQGKDADAREAVKGFLRHLCSIRVLDPACGTGNFLYVTLDLFKRLEGEVVKLLADLGDRQASLVMTGGLTVTPAQFLGIEVKPWAREIANLVLWIGYLQWQLRARGDASHFPEPVLQEYGNIECRDAVLAWDRIEPVLDADGKPVTRWDGVTTKESPVTGEAIPDDTALVSEVRYINPRKAEWPETDYIVGNPPYIGKHRVKLALGDGYVNAMRRAYDTAVPSSADFVMYWWHIAAELVTSGRVVRFGFVTTNSITQSFSRRVVQSALLDSRTHLAFAIPDHPWVDTADGAAVRIAMTVVAAGLGKGVLATVTKEFDDTADGSVAVTLSSRAGVIQADLRVGAQVVDAVPLRANDGLSSMGVMLAGRGFLVGGDEIASMESVVTRPIVNGDDILHTPRGLFVIDFNDADELEARRVAPAAYQRLLDRVKPERDANRDAVFREQWWKFGRRRPLLRAMIRDLEAYTCTVETAKHRVFVKMPVDTLPAHKLVVIGLSDCFFVGVLSSRVHVTWSLAAGGRLGVGNDPVYAKTRCFDPFPFPVCDERLQSTIRQFGEALDDLRRRQQARHPGLTLTNMYNVLETLRAGRPLTTKEKAIHDQGLVSVLRQLHDDLDAAVFDAYGWPHDLSDEQILERLVALNAERAEEERGGLIRWLRPEFQNPTGAKTGQGALVEVGGGKAVKGKKLAAEVLPWPKDLPSRIAAVRSALEYRRGATSTEDMAKMFKKAPRAEVASILESLSRLGLAKTMREGDRVTWSAVKIA